MLGYYVDGGPVPVSGSTPTTQTVTISTSGGASGAQTTGGSSNGIGFRPPTVAIFRSLATAQRRRRIYRGIVW